MDNFVVLADTAAHLRKAQETTNTLLDQLLEKKTEFLERFERVESRLGELEKKVEALWFAPGMPGYEAVATNWVQSQKPQNE